MTYPVVKMTGDTSVAVVFGDAISEEINLKIRAFDEALARENIAGIYETVPTYCTLMIHYAPEVIRYRELSQKLEKLLLGTHEAEKLETRIMEIPVCYGGEYGPDLDYVAEYHQMSKEEVIKLHTEAEYLIYMLGFTPGFSYMGGMDERIATPRLKTPRVLIPAGSVGIAGGQTGIYPIDSPGGWQLIGRTPVRMYDAERQTPILLDAGLHVRFVPINEEQYQSILQKVESGRYRCKTYVKEGE
ncbi:MAG: 5-oxoprolinase subunit PxpB [Firmicutes bacterium]|nr:5-oxoprolinase subunit PxpB [Bacillota bacterium]